jgi:hypothetical protein
LPAAAGAHGQPAGGSADHDARKRAAAEQRRHERAARAHQKRIVDLEARISEREGEMKQIERAMAQPGFYEDRQAAEIRISRHQTLMWEVGELMHQWEQLQTSSPSET